MSFSNDPSDNQQSLAGIDIENNSAIGVEIVDSISEEQEEEEEDSNKSSDSCSTTNNVTAAKNTSAEPFQIKTYSDLFNLYERLKYSKITTQFIQGNDLQSKDIDNTVNIFTLVNALIVTIPFTLLGSVNYVFWADLENMSTQQCPQQYSDFGPDLWHKVMYVPFTKLIFMAVYSSMTSICCALFYYCLRPARSSSFQAWWFRGKWIVYFQFNLTIFSVVASLVLVTHVMKVYSMPPSAWCAILYRDTHHVTEAYKLVRNSYIAGYASLSVCLFLTLFLGF